jgi:hypothetical protein
VVRTEDEEEEGRLFDESCGERVWEMDGGEGLWG